MVRSTPLPPPPSDLSHATTTAKPFPFLKLPKDIRLMIYEHLPITTKKHRIPMHNPTHQITLLNPSITGLRILLTCRQIHAEASYILRPHLTRMLATPPEIQIEAKHLVGFINFDEKFFPRFDILDRILASVGNPITRLSIHEYRVRGEEAFAKMEYWLHTRGLVEEGDCEGVKGVATFVLRAYAYRKACPSVFYKYPPMTITVTVPQIYEPQIVTSTVSRAMLLYHRIFFHVQRQRVHTGVTRLSWLFCRLAFSMSLKCNTYKSLGVCIKLRHTEIEDGKSKPVPQATEHKIHAMIMQGVCDAGGSGKRLVYYGGVVRDGEGDGGITR